MDMSIIAASRLRGIKKYNTFIGNIGDEFPDAATFRTACSSFNNIQASDFKNYEVDANNNVRFFIEKDYELGTNIISDRNIKFYVDLDGHLVNAQANMQLQNNNSFFYIPNDNPNNFSYRGNSNSIIVLPNATNIGTSSGDNDVFSIGTNGTLITNKIFETNNGGNPDGDIQEFISNGGSVTYKDLTDPAQNTPPPKLTSVETTNVGGTYVKLNENQYPLHINEYLGVMVYNSEGFLFGFFKKSLITGLNINTSYEVKIRTVDKYFNISELSDLFSFQTSLIPLVFQNAVAYYKFDEIDGDILDYINGDLIVKNGDILQGQSGIINNSVRINNFNSFLEFNPSFSDLFDSSWSMSFYVKNVNAQGSYSQILGTRGSGSSSINGIRLNNSNFAIYHNSNVINTVAGGLSANQVEGVWLGYTFDSSTGTLSAYRNGLFITSNTNSYFINKTLNFNPLRFGFYNNNNFGACTFNLDEASFYNTCLDSNQMAEIYMSTI